MLKNFRTYNLAVELYERTEKIKCKAYLKDQLMRAALSVVLNIVEGSAKRTEAERRRFYNIAYASSKEVQAILNLLKLTQEQILADKVSACLYRLHNPRPPA